MSTAPVAVPSGLRRPPTRQTVRFVLAGAVNTAFAVVVFVSLDLLLRHLVGYLVILLLAHVVGVLEAYVVYRRTVFQVRGHVLRDLARFESVYLVALGVNAALLPLLVEVVGLPVIASQVLIVAVTAMVSFVGHKHFSFRRPVAGG